MWLKVKDFPMEQPQKPNRKIDLQQRLDDVAAKNEQIAKVASLQQENSRLRDQMGQRKKGTRQSTASKISGLQSLRDSLGQQFT